MNIKKVFFSSLFAVPIFSSFYASAEESTGPFSVDNFSANITLTTDYMFRGETQSRNQPAVQGGLDWSHDIFYAGVWASNVNFDFVGLSNTFLEVDYYGGVASTVGPFDYDIFVGYYTYPGNDATNELDYLEIIPKLSYTLSDSPFEPSIYVQYGYSPDYFNEEGAGHNIEGGLGFSLPMDFGIDGVVGHQNLDGDAIGVDVEWTYWNVGLTKSVVGFDLDLRYHSEDEDTDPAFGPWLANDGLSDDIVTFGISRSF